MDNNRIDTNSTIVTGWTDGNLKITIETRRSISGDAGLVQAGRSNKTLTTELPFKRFG